ncbi:MAG: type II secretory pathway pseudopilin PulG [Phycisphaerales bacterium]|jgi:type II secretory pathway pseudopilin PulG
MSATRRGMTFLECVLGVLLLGMITSTLVQVSSNARLNQLRTKARLGAAELANRLVLQYLDDKDSLPTANLPIEFDGQYYRWSKKHSQVGAKIDSAAARSGADVNSSEKSLSRIQQVTFSVWLAEDSGGTFKNSDPTPSVSISRLYDPLLPTNPDAMRRLFSTPEGITQLMQSMQNLQEGLDVNMDEDVGGDE